MKLIDIPVALVHPDRAFAGGAVPRVPGVLLLVLLFATWVTGERLVQGAYQNSHAKTLAVLDVDARMRGLMQNAPTRVQDEVRGQMLDSILGSRSGVTTAAGIAISGAAFLVVLLELWLVGMVVAQFFGGQEDRQGGARPSGKLFLIAFVPLALRRLAAGMIMTLRSPDAAENALTLADYRRLSAVRFDLVSFLPFGDAAGFLASAARLLTDPFLLWSFVILCLGGREVYRVPLKSAAAICLVLAAVLALQSTLLSRIGVAWEM